MHNEPQKTDLESVIAETLAGHPGLTREQLLEHLGRIEDMTEAGRAPFPGPLREAFASRPPALFGFTLQPVTLELISLLEEIESPFIQMVEIIASMQGRPAKDIIRAIEKKLHPKVKDLAAANWCFLTPIDQVQATLDLGVAALRKKALKEISGHVPPAKLSALNDAVMLHYIAAFKTSVDYRAKKPEGDASFPLAPAEPKTVSAGAFTSAASSCAIST